LETEVKHFANRHGVKLGQIAQPLRAALTGSTTSPGIFDVMAVLDKTASLRRIARAIGR
jgi:glutamyl-tRNA synthetase